MEAAVGLFLILLVLSMFTVAGLFCYKYRARISKWVNSPYYACDDRKLHLQRRIENCQKEIAVIEANEKAETGE